MKPVETNNVITHLRIEFSGSEYQTALNKAVQEELSILHVAPIVRGQKRAAAGVGLSVDLVVAIAVGITSDLIAKTLIALFGRIKKTAAVGGQCHIGNVTIETESCDLKIGVNGSAGVLDEDVDYSSLISRMAQLRESEALAGRTVIAIEAPCDLVPQGDSFEVRNVGIGNYGLWLVSYQEGERWPYCLYDAANDCFVSLSDMKGVDVVGHDDPFYGH